MSFKINLIAFIIHLDSIIALESKKNWKYFMYICLSYETYQRKWAAEQVIYVVVWLNPKLSLKYIK